MPCSMNSPMVREGGGCKVLPVDSCSDLCNPFPLSQCPCGTAVQLPGDTGAQGTRRSRGSGRRCGSTVLGKCSIESGWNTCGRAGAACAALAFRVQHLSSSSLPALPGVGAERQKSTHELIEVVTSSPAALPTLAKFHLQLISQSRQISSLQSSYHIYILESRDGCWAGPWWPLWGWLLKCLALLAGAGSRHSWLLHSPSPCLPWRALRSAGTAAQLNCLK